LLRLHPAGSARPSPCCERAASGPMGRRCRRRLGPLPKNGLGPSSRGQRAAGAESPRRPSRSGGRPWSSGAPPLGSLACGGRGRSLLPRGVRPDHSCYLEDGLPRSCASSLNVFRSSKIPSGSPLAGTSLSQCSSTSRRRLLSSAVSLTGRDVPTASKASTIASVPKTMLSRSSNSWRLAHGIRTLPRLLSTLRPRVDPSLLPALFLACLCRLAGPSLLALEMP